MKWTERQICIRTSSAIHKQPAACGSVKAGVADKAGVLRSVVDVRGVDDDNLAAGHALANIIIRLARQLHVHASDQPGGKGLARTPLQQQTGPFSMPPAQVRMINETGAANAA